MPVSTRRVKPSGPVPCSIAFIGEGPGADEDKYLKPFVGKSGKVLWEMVGDYTGLTRQQVYVDNLSPFRLTDAKGKDRAPTPEEAEEFTPLLWDRLSDVHPDLVVTLGRFSTAALLGVDIPMEICHGRLYESGGPAVISSYHPAAGLHDPTLLAYTAADLQIVGRYLKGERDSIRAVPDAHPHPEYSIIRAVQPALSLSSPLAIDTEYDPVTHDPWCLTYSDSAGRAHLIRADDPKTLEAFRRGLEQARPEVILHFALADLEPLRRMGIDLLAMGLKIRDTGIELFLTQLNPQGLKRSAQRLCGVHMRDYEEVVGPVAERFLRDYLLSAISEPPAAWGTGEGRKWSILKRIEGMVYPRKTSAGDARTLREKYTDDAFDPIRAQIEKSFGPPPRPGIDDIPKEEFRDYACRDADVTRRQSYPLDDLMAELSLQEVHLVDHGVIPIVDRMQQVGLRVDVTRLDELRDYVRGELDAYLEICRILTGQDDFNPASGDEVAAFCTKMDLGLTKLTKGRTRIQVDENALIAIRYAHPAIEAFLTFRELDKLRGTYIEPLYKLLVGRGRFRRLYGHFRLTAAITGRLAMFDPNLMAFPTRTEVGRRLRRCFVAGTGHRIGSCDLSQIELRVGAALSQDERMMDAFQRDADIHMETAVAMFDLPPESIDEMLHRYPAKTTNFAMFFGATGRRLNSEFLKAGIPGWDEKRCDGFVEKWFELYSGVRDWINTTVASGARDGFVRTAAGRLRYLPALRFARDDYPFNRIREEAERHASNFPVQGTAQEIEKRGMKVVWDEVIPAVQAAGYYMEPMLQIHDDLMTEFDAEAEELVKDLMLEAMTRESPWRGVPIKASWKSGTDWGSLEK